MESLEQLESVRYSPDEMFIASASGSEEPESWINRFPDGGVLFTCLWAHCYTVCDKAEALLHHIRSHIAMLSARYQNENTDVLCPITRCGTILSTVPHLYRHLYMHIYHVERQWMGLTIILGREDVAEIPHCGFRSSMELIYDGSPMACCWADCTTVWNDVSLFCTHVNEHVDALGVLDRDSRLQLACYWQDCGLCFKNKANLRVHCRHHSGDKTAACPFCGVFFSNNSKLIDHMLRKNQLGTEDANVETTLYSCNLCQKQFGTQRLLREHCRRHVMNHKCEYCSVTVDSPSALQRHIAAVHAKRRIYGCFCGRRFTQKADLERHMHLHSTEFEYKCEHCGAQFRWKKQLTAHVRKHDADYKPYTHLCHLCDAKYTNGFGLSRHLVRKHQATIPRGFTRFQYKKCKDGFARLQTKRCLSKALASDLGFKNREGKEKYAEHEKANVCAGNSESV